MKGRTATNIAPIALPILHMVTYNISLVILRQNGMVTRRRWIGQGRKKKGGLVYA